MSESRGYFDRVAARLMQIRLHRNTILTEWVDYPRFRQLLRLRKRLNHLTWRTYWHR